MTHGESLFQRRQKQHVNQNTHQEVREISHKHVQALIFGCQFNTVVPFH